MATRKNKNQNKKIICGVIILFLVVAGGVAGILMWHNSSNRENDSRTETVSSDESKTETIERTTDGTGSTTTDIEKEKVTQYDGEDPNTSENLSGVVTYADVVDDQLMIRLNIDQYLDSGECELTLTKDGATIYTSIANIVGGPATATCEGFDVPVEELGGGNIQININLSAGDRKGSIRGEANI